MTNRTLYTVICTAFAASNLSDFPLFTDSDVGSKTKSHHYNLSLHSSLTPFTSLTPPTSQTSSDSSSDTLSTNSTQDLSSITLAMENLVNMVTPPPETLSLVGMATLVVTPTSMPTHGNRTPQFDPTKPRELLCCQQHPVYPLKFFNFFQIRFAVLEGQFPSYTSQLKGR